MKVEVTEGAGLLRKVSVEIPPEQVRSQMDQKFLDVRKNVEIKGFRKGKAPMDRIKAMFTDRVKVDVMEDLIKSSYPEAVRQNALRVAVPPKVTAADFTADGGFSYTAEVEIFPQIDRIDYDNLVVTIPKMEVADRQVDEFIEVMRWRMAELRVVDRAAAKDDVVQADITKLEDPKKILKQDSFEKQEIDLASPNTVREFREQIPGMKVGDRKEIEVVYPEDYPDEGFAGANVKYAISVRQVSGRVLPPANDAFAKATRQAETLLELRLKVRQELQQRLVREQERHKRSQIIAQICEKNQIPVPEAFLSDYLNRVAEDFRKRYKDVTDEDIHKNYREVGLKTIRWDLLYTHLAQAEKIEVLPSDTEKRIKRFADSYQMTMEQAKEALRRSGSADEIRDSILEEKVLDFLSEKTKVVYADIPREEPGTDSTTP